MLKRLLKLARRRRGFAAWQGAPIINNVYILLNTCAVTMVRLYVAHVRCQRCKKLVKAGGLTPRELCPISETLEATMVECPLCGARFLAHYALWYAEREPDSDTGPEEDRDTGAGSTDAGPKGKRKRRHKRKISRSP